jgi:Helix-turn-helix domain
MDRLITEPTAQISGGAAWLISRVLASENLAKVLSRPPAGVDRADVAAAIAAINAAGRAWETDLTLRQRDNATALSATVPQSATTWTTAEAADYLKISRRRAQEIAANLGGTRIGRHWVIPVVAVRRLAEQRAAA